MRAQCKIISRVSRFYSQQARLINRTTIYSDDAELNKEEVTSILRKKGKAGSTPAIKARIDEEGDKVPHDPLSRIKKVTVPEVVKIDKQGLKKIDESATWNKIEANRSLIHQIRAGLVEMPDSIEKFKFGLPIPNIDPEFKGVEEITEMFDDTPPTATMNLFNALALTGDTSYQEFQSAIKARLNTCI